MVEQRVVPGWLLVPGGAAFLVSLVSYLQVARVEGPQLSDPDYKDRQVVREADLRRHLLAQSKVEDKLLEGDDTPDPRFSAKADELEKKGIKDFQLYYALNTLKRLAVPVATASAAPAKKLR